MGEFKEAPDEGAGNKKKKIVAGAAGIVALFAGCKLLKICKKWKQKKEDEGRDDS